MRPPLRLLSSAIVTGFAAVALSGCGGDDVPDNAVATIGDTVITRADYDKWHKFVVLSPFLKGEPDEVFRRQTMQALIESEWVEQEAAAQHITVSDEEIQRLWEERKSQFPPGEFRQLLKDSGLAEKDLRYRVKIEQLQRKLEEALTAKEPRVTDQDIAAYFEQHRKRFVLPERRDFIYVSTKTKAKAAQAKEALQGGASWDAAVKQYSKTPKDSKARAVKGPSLSVGQEDLERAIYKTGKGQLNGPVKTTYGWYVFEVTKVMPSSPQSLADVKVRIRAFLESRRKPAAVDRFHAAYRDKTVCADELKTPECSNGPKEKSSAEEKPST
jgi:foldase protein PrsA